MNMRKIVGLLLLVAFIAPMGFNALAFADGNKKYIPPAWSRKLPTNKRFKLVLDDEAVLDKETGLVWERSPDTTLRDWINASLYAYNKEVGDRKGWRLPTAEELASLIDPTQSNPVLPAGHPFTNVQFDHLYWSTTTGNNNSGDAMVVDFDYGNVSIYFKDNEEYVWCVRGGHGYDAY